MHEIIVALKGLEELNTALSTIKDNEEGSDILIREYNRGIKDLERFIKKTAKGMEIDKETVDNLLKDARIIRMDFVRIINKKRKEGEDYKEELKWLTFINDSAEFYSTLFPEE